jgi:hypothetical protein
MKMSPCGLDKMSPFIAAGEPWRMPEGNLLMSGRERNRLAVLARVKRGELKPEWHFVKAQYMWALCGQLHSNLSWTHYRTLLRVEKPAARAFYEIEALQNNWSARELERRINSLHYERLALSRDKKGLLRLARKGKESRVKGRIAARAEKHRPGRRRPTGPGKKEDQAINPLSATTPG